MAPRLSLIFMSNILLNSLVSEYSIYAAKPSQPKDDEPGVLFSIKKEWDAVLKNEIPPESLIDFIEHYAKNFIAKVNKTGDYPVKVSEIDIEGKENVSCSVSSSVEDLMLQDTGGPKDIPEIVMDIWVNNTGWFTIMKAIQKTIYITEATSSFAVDKAFVLSGKSSGKADGKIDVDLHKSNNSAAKKTGLKGEGSAKASHDLGFSYSPGNSSVQTIVSNRREFHLTTELMVQPMRGVRAIWKIIKRTLSSKWTASMVMVGKFCMKIETIDGNNYWLMKNVTVLSKKSNELKLFANGLAYPIRGEYKATHSIEAGLVIEEKLFTEYPPRRIDWIEE